MMHRTTLCVPAVRAWAGRNLAWQRKAAGLAVLACLVGGAAAQSVPAAPDSGARFRVLHSFAAGSDRHTGGSSPDSPVQAGDGNFYGTSFNGGRFDQGTIYRTKPDGRTITVHSFDGADGSAPVGALVQASDGNLYGVTYFGGDADLGTVFRLDATGLLTTLHNFRVADGDSPGGSLVQASDGNLYGTTAFGGEFGHGTVFRIGLDGTFAVVYSFGASPQDGGSSLAPLIQSRDGRLCGASWYLGLGGGGTVYCMTLAGEMSVLYGFGTGRDEVHGPAGPLVEGDDGSLYGTSNAGGAHNSGTVFRLGPDGTLQAIDIAGHPSGGLLKASDGNFYGLSLDGGQFGAGWVYRVSPSHKVTDVHSFDIFDGFRPQGELIEGADGRLYGVAPWGGADNAGVFFGITRPAR